MESKELYRYTTTSAVGFILSSSAVLSASPMINIKGKEAIPSPVKYSCDNCKTPVAEIVGGCLVIRSRHFGEKHITIIDLKSLYESISQ